MDHISEYIDGYSFNQFLKDSCGCSDEIIGEASKNISSKLKTKYPSVPWMEMYLLRNRVAHEYFGIDFEIIWDVAVNYLPENRIQLQEILDTEGNW